jgi:D-alanyl-D-alanine carboxypeptidase
LQDKLDQIHAAGRFPGITAGFALPDGTSFALAAGVSDREAKTAMQPADRMLAGSVGKTFVAALALSLVHEGKLGLDDPVATHLDKEPWFDRLPNGASATVRMLMNHTSGLVRYEFEPAFAQALSADPDRVWRPDELVAYVLGKQPPFAPGAGWVYSDTNYIVLGMILERVGGGPLYEQIERRFVEPLRLTGTVPSDRREIAGVVQGYAGSNNPFGGADAMLTGGRFAINPQFEWAGGGFATTAEDLARWAQAIHEGKAFARSMNGQFLQGVAAPMLGRGVRYGLGVILWETPLGPAHGHSGFFPGYLAEMRYYPHHRIAVAILVNTSVTRSLGRSPGSIIHELARTAVE